MKVRFYVEKRRGDNDKLLLHNRPLFMTVSFNGNRVIISTGVKVDVQAWDQQEQKVKNMHPESVVINNWLVSLKNTAGVTWNALVSLSEKPGANEFRREFERLRPRVSGRFFDVFLSYIEEGSDQWSVSNYRKIRTVYNQLNEFEQTTGYELAFHKLNDLFLEKYVDFYKSKGLAISTIWKSLNTLVTFLNWSTHKGYNIYNNYRSFYKQLSPGPKVDSVQEIYLDWNEVKVLVAYSTSNTREERARDIFLLMCFTGIRFAEIQRLEKSDVKKEAIQLRGRNGTVRLIELNEPALEITQKYASRYYPDNRAFPEMSLITMNKYLRIIGHKAGLNRIINNYKGRNGDDRFLYEVIAVRLAVNTFIYHALRLGISADSISYYTGVRKDKRIEMLRMEFAAREIKKFNKV